MATLTLTFLNGYQVDLDNAASFVVEIPRGSSNFAIVKIQTDGKRVPVYWEEDWDMAHIIRERMQRYIIEEKRSLKIDEITGQVVPV
jgi:hypothetical protein